ncbi:MAG TPA: ABC transporter ATP-binding protein [Bradyrhizobium sp.]|uniref:ABC transporter ATP-binding protein n=1 Tax=Bradyrhizobium sp. TaxID=376 RepID=UPI002D7FF607|nr:ABC transporter ATP-binding protein [Bradyrhizobium sp.]HET7885734.1 ABC transporter ATP-binding protein [Bradyrhizobium sp.]
MTIPAPAITDAAVSFDGVTKTFGEVKALDNVSLAVGRGEFMTLLGPSGCGKTTLLKLAAGFLGPDGGSVNIDGNCVNEVPTYKREIGMMFQNYALFPHMSVADNIAYGLKTRRVARADIRKRVAEALALVKLSGMDERKPKQLSGGQQQRVALARALVINPTVLLLDEPFSALDKNLRGSMQIELRDIQRKLGLTTIFVTHDQSEALSLSDRVAVMSEGKIRQLGTPLDIYREPADRFVASFVGDANRLRGELVSVAGLEAVITLGGIQITVPAGRIGAATPSTSIDLFVRPERLRIVAPDETATMTGRIVAQTYHGGHVDLQIACSACGDDLLLVRSSGDRAMIHLPPGTEVGISIDPDGCAAFPFA